MKFNGLLSIMLLCASFTVRAEDVGFSVNDMVYEGAIRFKDGVYGVSRLGFANGAIAVDTERSSVFIVGHEQHQAIAEYEMPGFSKSMIVQDLPMAVNVQPYTTIFDKVTDDNTDKLNTITGLNLIDGRLVVNVAQYYDGDGGNTDTTIVIAEPRQIADSSIAGYIKMDSAVRGSGWLTKIPNPLQNDFGYDYISGYASNLPINGRNSMGPSAFGINSTNLLSAKADSTISMEEFLGFSIENQLHEDHYNESGTNDIWTEIARAHTGIIVPGTNTYAVFGYSGGHEAGIGYKIRGCGGACPIDAGDVYNHYWFWSLDDLQKVKSGLLQPHQIRPYEYGRFELPFELQDEFDTPRLMSGASYDYENQLLYFTLGRADKSQGRFEYLPILLKYSLKVGQRPNSPSNASVVITD